MSKDQGNLEFFIIAAVVCLIVLFVIVVIGGIPGIGGAKHDRVVSESYDLQIRYEDSLNRSVLDGICKRHVGYQVSYEGYDVYRNSSDGKLYLICDVEPFKFEDVKVVVSG